MGHVASTNTQHKKSAEQKMVDTDFLLPVLNNFSNPLFSPKFA